MYDEGVWWVAWTWCNFPLCYHDEPGQGQAQPVPYYDTTHNASRWPRHSIPGQGQAQPVPYPTRLAKQAERSRVRAGLAPAMASRSGCPGPGPSLTNALIPIFLDYCVCIGVLPPMMGHR